MAFNPVRALDAVFRSQGVQGTLRLSSGDECAVRYRVTRPDEQISGFAAAVSLPTRQVEIRNSEVTALPRAPQQGDTLISDDEEWAIINTPERLDPLALVWTLDLK